MKPYQNLTRRGQARRLRRLAVKSLERYALEVERIRLITNDTNGIFRVDTCNGEKWILRVTQPEGGHNYDHVAAEIDFLSALARDTRLNVPRPLAARNGRYVVEASVDGVPEARLCVIFSWVPGRNLADRLTAANMRMLGSLSAQLHEYARTYHPPAGLDLLAFDRVFPFPEPVVLFEKSFENKLTQDQRDIFRQGVALAQAAIDQLKSSGEPMRIIHGDLHQWNVRYSHGLLTPIDFEDLMWGWPVQDIAITLYYSLPQPNYPELRAAFEQGYQQICPWPERYEGEINAFIAARGIGLLNFVLQNEQVLDINASDFALLIENRLHGLL